MILIMLAPDGLRIRLSGFGSTPQAGDHQFSEPHSTCVAVSESFAQLFCTALSRFGLYSDEGRASSVALSNPLSLENFP